MISSVLWIAGMPLLIVGLLSATAAQLVLWIPMGVFEVVFAVWMIVKGVDAPVRGQPVLRDYAGA